MFARFVQEYRGQKLHIVEADANTKKVSAEAICGRKGNWRMSINMPLASLCGKCARFARGVQIVEF